ncbi:unnamed protein product [Bursaphelenchus xylophilus]|uniref:(pine wood nematode) hypothetical protein n=1 Tax=Bursaphelenchus xylophilus TaxID=6326 RepID=A0A1I7SR01_BURXY|nr:unnamed protein product [Bursaphelenchus xylophilus]CAG9110638.1 unnamed protein product [Bursaphelenchus xylophilus]
MSQYHTRTPSGHPDQRPGGPPGPPGTTVPLNFETHEIPPSERLQIPEVRIKRAGSADPREYGPQDHQIQHQGPPVHGQGQPPAAFQNDAFFNERITIPRPVAMNEQEHFATEEFDNKDRGDLDEEEHSYDKQVRHSHFRSGSLPAKRFGERSLFADRSLYDERAEVAQRGGGYHYRWNYHHGPERREALPQYDHRELANEPWREYEQRREAANAERFRSEQAYREEQQRREEEERRRFGASHQRSHAYRSSSVGPVGGAGERYGYEEHYSGGIGSNYVRPEYTSTLRRDARQQQQQRSSHHQSRQAGGGSSGWAYSSWGNRGGPYKEQRYRKIRCCCFSFYWPPWGYEEAEPPRPLYPSNNKAVGPPPPAHLGPPPPLEEYPPGPQKRPY